MRNLKTFFVMVASAMILSGCYVTQGEMAWAVFVCQEHGGVDTLWTNSSVICLDGSVKQRGKP